MKPCVTTSPRRAAVLAAAALLPGSPASAQQPPTGAGEPEPAPAERCREPEHRQFDFWLGRWEVRSADGALVGHNEITRVGGGCGLLESWRGLRGGAGVSVNAYDAERGRWNQRWVGDGATLWLEGAWEEGPGGGRMLLTGIGPRSTPRGEVLDRISWTPLPDGRVRQLWEVSADGGSTWQPLFEGFYSPAPS